MQNKRESLHGALWETLMSLLLLLSLPRIPMQWLALQQPSCGIMKITCSEW